MFLQITISNKIFIASDSQEIVNHTINIFGNDKILSY